MASGLIIDYLASGVAASRPVSLSLHTGAVGLYYATDTNVLSAWDGTTWEDVGGTGSLDATLTAFAALTIAANSLTIGTGADAFAQTTFAANKFPARASTGDLVAKDITDFALTLLDDSSASTARSTLGVEAPRNTATALATSGSVAIDYALGDYFTLALAGNVTTFTFSNLPGAGKGATLMVQITQDATPRTVGWPASFKWAGGTTGAVSTGSGAVDVLAMTTFDNGTTWRVTLAKAFS